MTNRTDVFFNTFGPETKVQIILVVIKDYESIFDAVTLI